jgi:hypothetical protein
MTINDPPILRNSALAAPLVVLGVALTLGAGDAVGAAIGSAVVLVNLWVLSVLGPRLVKALARDESTVLWMVALAAKFVLLIGTFFVLLRTVSPFGLMLGFVPLMVGALGTGMQLALQESAEEG